MCESLQVWVMAGDVNRSRLRESAGVKNPMNKRQMMIKMQGRGLWAAVLLASACAWGQELTRIEGISHPLYVGNIAPVLDPLGRPLRGTHQPAGASYESRVELRISTNGIVRPPYTNGMPHPYHPLVNYDSFGNMGMNTSGRDTGLFCMALSGRPSPDVYLFARAYNAPTVEEATFYADSHAVKVPASAETQMILTFKPAQPINTNSWTGDGFTVSHAELLGIDDGRVADYDGDGVSNWHEWLAGTAPDDPDSYLGFRLVRREIEMPVPADAQEDWSKPVRVRWQSVPGKRYQLEYVPMLTLAEGEPPVFVPVGAVVTAGESEHEIDMLIEVPADSLTGTFRIRLVVE